METVPQSDAQPPDPIIAVRLGIAPPWRLTLSAAGTIDGDPLPSGTYEVHWNGGVRLCGMGTNAAVSRLDPAAMSVWCPAPCDLNGHHFRGILTFRRWSVLNRLDLEDYLRGVVGQEIGPSAEMEALKAQAVVARTYVLAHLGSEVPDNTTFQVYRGVDAETPAVNAAVEATAGQVLTWHGRLARYVCYHSTCGGYTEANENVFMTRPVPYLRSVPCVIPSTVANTGDASGATADGSASQPVPVPEATMEEVAPGIVAAPRFSTSRGSSGAAAGPSPARVEPLNGSPTGTTGTSLAPACLPTPLSGELAALSIPAGSAPPEPAWRHRSPLPAGAVACSRSPWAHWVIRWPVAHVPVVRILRRSPAGRVVEVMVRGHRVWGDDIRRALRFRDVNGKLSSLPSTMFTMRREGDEIVVCGRGWGHGVGLCQWGARGMARAGVGYAAILAHYFPGTVLSAISQ